MSLSSMRTALARLRLLIDGSLANGSGRCLVCWTGTIARVRDDGILSPEEPAPPEPCPGCGQVPRQLLVTEAIVHSRQHWRELCQEGRI